MAIDPAAFKTECETDPSGLGLAAPFAAGQNQSVVDILNLPRASIQLPPPFVKRSDVIGAVLHTDLPAAVGTPTEKEINEQRWFENGVLADEVIPNTVELRAFITAAIGNTGNTRTRLAALVADVDTSRAQELWTEDATLDVARKAQVLP